MEIGIFAKTFARPTLEACLDAVAAHGLTSVQFNMECAGLDPLPDSLAPHQVDRIRAGLAQRGIAMAALSGTFNMIHPNPRQRQDGLQRLAVLAAHAAALGGGLITLCTGTRDPDHMWRHHPENDGAAAWSDLLESMAAALEIAHRHRVVLGVEPEVANVVDSAPKARCLLDAMASPYLRIVMDGANLFHRGELARMHRVLDEAFELLGPDIALAHAKDLTRDGAAGNVAAGRGLLDYPYYLRQLRAVGYAGPVILHSLTEAEVPAAVAFVRQALQGGDG